MASLGGPFTTEGLTSRELSGIDVLVNLSIGERDAPSREVEKSEELHQLGRGDQQGLPQHSST